MPVNLLDLDAQALAGFFGEIGEKPFRARQVMRWIHQSGASEFGAMSDLAKSLREKLVDKGETADAPLGRVDDFRVNRTATP